MRRGIRLKGIKRITKPNGSVYVYRRVGGSLVPLPNLPENSQAFLEAYIAAGSADLPKKTKAKAGTIAATIEAFKDSRSFESRAESTQVVWRRILDHMSAEYGIAKTQDLRTHHINKDLAKVSAGAARPRRTIWRALLQFAKEQGEVEVNPARDAVIAKYESKPHPPWTADDIKKFREFWAVGTPERQAMEVVFWTGARCVDARTLGWQLVENGVLEFVQQKTGGTAFVPITDEPPEMLKSDQKTFLECIGKDMIWITTRNGKPRSQKGLSQFISAAASKAKLPNDRTAHGLRKARAISLVYAGWTPHQIGAWTGHDSLKEIEDYTKGVNKRALVSSGNGKLVQIGFQKSRKT